ncbi:MAG: hypothetical protein FJ271_01225 [Planctomycetes bacterium]|nr:hypothetical protein [Planctomycetota bacterium]
MTPWQKTRKPSPELFAAHAAGELDGDAALAPVKEHVERWLIEHPEDRHPADASRLLDDLWKETRPAEPGAGGYKAILERLYAVPVPRGWPLWSRAAAWLSATAAAVWLAMTFWPEAPLPVADKPADPLPGVVAVVPFPVATSGEIEILSVEGSDTASLVIGQPVHGPIELLAPGEVILTSVEPAASDNMLPRVHESHETPLIWARVESEP